MAKRPSLETTYQFAIFLWIKSCQGKGVEHRKIKKIKNFKSCYDVFCQENDGFKWIKRLQCD